MATAAALNLIVIYSPDIERACQFYSALGMAFTKEKHGNGPEHYAAASGAIVLEIYPADEAASSICNRLGFRVQGLDELLPMLTTLGGTTVAMPKDSPWGRRAVMSDPDGRRVELTELSMEHSP